MPSCQNYEDRLASAAAAEARGEPLDRQETASLRRHLAVCAPCRAELTRLRQVEAALHAWPLAPLQHDLVRPVLAQLAREPRQPAWQWLPWTVWLPALVIALALGLALAGNMAGQLIPAGPLHTYANAGVEFAQGPVASTLAKPLSASNSELFWAIWCGLFITLAGVGLSLGLTTGGRAIDSASEELKERWEHLREAAHL